MNFQLCPVIFWYPLSSRAIQYFIGKLLDMVKMGQEKLLLAALLISVKASWKLKYYYIDRALSKLNCYPLHENPKWKPKKTKTKQRDRFLYSHSNIFFPFLGTIFSYEVQDAEILSKQCSYQANQTLFDQLLHRGLVRPLPNVKKPESKIFVDGLMSSDEYKSKVMPN